MGDFNFHLLKYNTSNEFSHFLESIVSNSLFSFIIQPTRIITHSKTVIDNIFLNFYSSKIISGNLTASISDHLAQYIIIPHTKMQTSPEPFVRRCFKNFKKAEFIQDISNVEWDDHIKEDNDVNDSIKKLIEIFDCILNKHPPYKKLTKNRANNHNKLWSTKFSSQ